MITTYYWISSKLFAHSQRCQHTSNCWIFNHWAHIWINN